MRQSVSRLESAGYKPSSCSRASSTTATAAELEHVSALWRDGAPERGFSMAMDPPLRGARRRQRRRVARDADGAIRGFLHFVPAYGRAAMSLSAMRRDRETPNGLMEFLVVQSIELLRGEASRSCR